MRAYHEVVPITREEAEVVFTSGNAERICDAIVRLTYFDPDGRWVQTHCIALAGNENPDVRGLAATCLGHLARIHRALDLEAVLPLLQQLSSDPEVCGRVSDALDDIQMFLPNKPEK